MAYRVVDDDTALAIYETIQKRASRDFARYDRIRQLPRHKISGELVFYLDELLDFGKRELKRDPSESLAEVIDAGIVSWFGNLAPDIREKLDLHIADKPAGEVTALNEDGSKMELLEEKNRALSAEVSRLKEEIAALKRENVKLQIANEELLEGGDVAKGNAAFQDSSRIAYLGGDPIDSGYTELTSHLLTASGRTDTSIATQNKKSRSKSKKNRRRKK
jgi:hypothetical protein